MNDYFVYSTSTETYTGQSNAAVTALGRCCRLFDVVVDKLSTGGLYNASAVLGGVVGLSFAESDALGHSES